MYSTDESWLQNRDAAANEGAGLFEKISRALFGSRVVAEQSPLGSRLHVVLESRPVDDDMGWLSLTSDADGHSSFEGDVICMGVTPDDLDVHDPDGGDLSWIGLSPVKPNGQ